MVEIAPATLSPAHAIETERLNEVVQEHIDNVDAPITSDADLKARDEAFVRGFGMLEEMSPPIARLLRDRWEAKKQAFGLEGLEDTVVFACQVIDGLDGWTNRSPVYLRGALAPIFSELQRKAPLIHRLLNDRLCFVTAYEAVLAGELEQADAELRTLMTRAGAL